MAQPTHHGNRLDAREGGETPPLPRNCKRSCFAALSSVKAGIQPGSFRPLRKALVNHCMTDLRLWEGGW